MKTYRPDFRFSTLGTALSFADRAVKRMRVVMGDDGYFWVVTPAEATRLERQGYELAR